MPSSDKFKFTPRTDILNKNETKEKKTMLEMISFPVVEKHEARQYLLDRKVPEFAMKDLLVPRAQTLSLLSQKYKDRVLAKDPRIVLPFYDENGENCWDLAVQ